MKLTTVFTALASLGFLSASPVRTDGGESPAPTPLQPGDGPAHTAVLLWEPADAYKKRPKRRAYWELKCGETLARKGCGVGLIHVGEVSLTKPNGANTSYLNVQGAPLTNMENTTKMRVFFDGSSQDGWSARDHTLVAMAEARKRGRKKAREARKHRAKKTDPQPAERQKAFLFWDPADAYEKQKQRKMFWEKQCHEALAREDCDIGMIHQGESPAIKPNGEKTSYVKVEGMSANMDHTKQMRVFLDGSSEHGWSERDRQSLAIRGSSKKRRKPQRYTRNPKNKISWDPPDAYEKSPNLRTSFETACDKAFEREGCDLGIIHKGLHKVTNHDGTQTRHMTVSAGKQNNPEDTRYMQIFEDGSYQWYPPGQLPHGVVRRLRSKLVSVKNKRPRGRPKKEESTSPLSQARRTGAVHPGPSQAPGGHESQHTGTSSELFPSPGGGRDQQTPTRPKGKRPRGRPRKEMHTSSSPQAQKTEAARSEVFQGPGGGDYPYLEGQLTTKKHTRESSKRRRVGKDEERSLRTKRTQPNRL